MEKNGTIKLNERWISFQLFIYLFKYSFFSFINFHSLFRIRIEYILKFWCMIYIKVGHQCDCYRNKLLINEMTEISLSLLHSTYTKPPWWVRKIAQQQARNQHLEQNSRCFVALFSYDMYGNAVYVCVCNEKGTKMIILRFLLYCSHGVTLSAHLHNCQPPFILYCKH